MCSSVCNRNEDGDRQILVPSNGLLGYREQDVSAVADVLCIRVTQDDAWKRLQNLLQWMHVRPAHGIWHTRVVDAPLPHPGAPKRLQVAAAA